MADQTDRPQITAPEGKTAPVAKPPADLLTPLIGRRVRIELIAGTLKAVSRYELLVIVDGKGPTIVLKHAVKALWPVG